MEDLNPRQVAAVRYLDGPLLVLAGAGSGKTRVITRKIAYLVRECGISPRHIAAVTFTNKAAREMKARVASLLPGKEAKGLTVSTFHTLGLNMLRREHARIGYRAEVSILDAQDSAALIRELLGKETWAADHPAEQLQRRISHWKNALVEPEQALVQASDEAEAAAARLYGLYDRHLRAYNAVDFDDLIRLPARLFQQSSEALEAWQNRIRYLLVDEYQDTNASQYQLVKRLMHGRGVLTAVGDDDQSVYAWRGARPENLNLLSDDFPRLKVIKLEQNYRSTRCILRAANRLIANNPHVFEKALWSELGEGDPIRVLACRDEQHEAEQVVSELLQHQFKHRCAHGDYAILYRSNHQARVFERVLREHRIPYFLSGGTSFFERSEVKDLMAYLRLITNHDDNNAFLRIVNTPRREIGPSTLEKLGQYAGERGVSLLAASFEMGLTQRLSEQALMRLMRFTEWMVDVGDRARRGDAIGVVRDMIKDIGYESWLKETCKDLRAAERCMANVYELVAWLERLSQREIETKPLSELVAHLTLMDILERADEEGGGDRVHLMTLHAAKGLEFSHVFMVGMEEELLPHRESLAEERLEEERRLAYVGITRAQRTLTFSLASRRRRYGESIDCQPSRFLSELPQQDLAWQGKGAAVEPEKRQERGQAHLANLRGMLGQG